MKVIKVDSAIQIARMAKSIKFILGPLPSGVHSEARANKFTTPKQQKVKSTGPNTMYMYSATIQISLSKMRDISSQTISPIVSMRVTTAELMEYPVKIILMRSWGL